MEIEILSQILTSVGEYLSACLVAKLSDISIGTFRI